MIFQPQIVGKPLPTLTNPGTAADLLSGKQLIDANGNVLTGTIPTQGAQTITPGTSNRTIAAGRYLTGTQTVQGDADLVPGNIKSGVSIFGVLGTLTEGAEYHFASNPPFLNGKTIQIENTFKNKTSGNIIILGNVHLSTAIDPGMEDIVEGAFTYAPNLYKKNQLSIGPSNTVSFDISETESYISISLRSFEDYYFIYTYDSFSGGNYLTLLKI